MKKADKMFLVSAFILVVGLGLAFASGFYLGYHDAVQDFGEGFIKAIEKLDVENFEINIDFNQTEAIQQIIDYQEQKGGAQTDGS